MSAAVAERGILFSAPMVRAILAGQKSVTRRIVTANSGRQSHWLTPALLGKVPRVEMINDGVQLDHPGGGPLGFVRCPYGVAGDRLWVRETWRLAPSSSRNTSIQYRANDDMRRVPEHVTGDEVDRWLAHRGYVYIDGHGYRCTETKREQRWNPAIHLPRWASRITLDVVSVRVERLHEITEEDAVREGISNVDVPFGMRAEYAQLWDRINGAGAWERNDWVWRVEFARSVEVSS